MLSKSLAPALAGLLLIAPIAMAAQPAESVQTLLDRSRAAAAEGNAMAALRLAQAAIVAAPADPAPYVLLGEIYARANQADYARNFYDMALNIDPLDTAAKRALAALPPPAETSGANAADSATEDAPAPGPDSLDKAGPQP